MLDVLFAAEKKLVQIFVLGETTKDHLEAKFLPEYIFEAFSSLALHWFLPELMFWMPTLFPSRTHLCMRTGSTKADKRFNNENVRARN